MKPQEPGASLLAVMVSPSISEVLAIYKFRERQIFVGLDYFKND